MPSELTLGKVTSFIYLIGGSRGAPGYWNSVGASPVQLVFTNGGAADNYTPLDRSVADPDGNKLLLAYVEATEADSHMYPAFFAGGVPTSPLIGRLVPGFENLYTVQYWDPLWLEIVEGQIDAIAAAGYDGVFLDSLGDDGAWLPGNVFGNIPNPSATAQMADLILAIRSHVDGLHLGRPFYIVGNNPTGVALAYPDAIRNLDGVLIESLYWGHSPTDGSVSVYEGTANATWFRDHLAPVLVRSGAVLFGNDYPFPLTDLAQDFQSFAAYAEIGILPSVQAAWQTNEILATGPFMFMATADAASVRGSQGFVNFMSGGLAESATLVGGDLADFFIGGPGRNDIAGGAGADIIYAHPEAAAEQGFMKIQYVSLSVDSPSPYLEVRVNGSVALARTPLQSEATGSVPHEIVVDLREYSVIASIEFQVTGGAQNYPASYANVGFRSLEYSGVTVPLASGTWSNNVGTPGFFNPNDTATFSGSLFRSHYPAGNSDSIDGGAGTDTVVYRGPYAGYAIVAQADGSVVVTSASTAEGPDTLTNIEHLQFLDGTVVRESASQVSAELDSLQSLAAAHRLIGISFTDTTTPTLVISAEQLVNDPAALAAIGQEFNVEVTHPTTGAAIVGGVAGLATTVAFPGAASQYTITAVGNGHDLTVATGSSAYELRDVISLKFDDAAYIVASQVAPGASTVSSAQVASLYAAVLARQPDVGGLAFYERVAVDSPWVPIFTYAQWFLMSPEYSGNPAHAYSQSQAGEEQFIIDTYNNLLHRDPEPGAIEWYMTNVINPVVGGMAPGTAYAQADLTAHARLLTYFSLSAEFLHNVQVTGDHPPGGTEWLVLV
jgi:Ca2+-binding RTX toxin-like protein